jgi:hypothetical protein
MMVFHNQNNFFVNLMLNSIVDHFHHGNYVFEVLVVELVILDSLLLNFLDNENIFNELLLFCDLIIYLILLMIMYISIYSNYLIYLH